MHKPSAALLARRWALGSESNPSTIVDPTIVDSSAMQASRVLTLILALAAHSGKEVLAARSRAATNPLGKVLQLMDGLAAKVTKEGEAEAKAYKEFFAWCDDAAKNKQFEIKTATSQQEQLEATITKETADSEAASVKIEELAASISASDADLANATTIREREAKDFAASEAELVDTIDTLGRALIVLQKEMAKNPAAFAQMATSGQSALLSSLGALVDAAAFSAADKSRLVALVQSRQSGEAEDEDLGAPAASVYKSHSSGILDVLEDMKEKAEEELGSLRKAETNSKHNYGMLKQSLEDQMAADTKDMAGEKSTKSAAVEAKATAEGDLAKTVEELADANDALQMANSNCMQTAANHEATVKAREEELKVIAEAKKIVLESTGGAESQSYSLLQAERAQSLSLLRTSVDLASAEVLTAVKKLARENHSAALAQLASRIAAVLKFGAAAGEDPFTKVKGLISDLISKLEAEAQGEADEKAYCDEQIAKTEEKKGELEEDVSKLTAKIDKAVARSAQLKGEVKELQAELAALAKEQAEMDKTRAESHTDYVNSKADLEAGLAGVRKALGVLRTYYGGAAAAAMLQGGSDDMNALMRQPAMPETHSKSTGAGSSIIGILEVCESDFAKNLAEEETEESDAASLYEKTTQENKVTTATKEQDVKYLTQEFKGLDKSISELSTDRESSNSELSAVLEYYAKIKERCIAKPETYEARKARREAEIKGLKEALVVLQDETAFVQRGKKGSQGHHFLG
mmetsp:Transcript_111734/g.271438  ORF Transcript_111734/g.271438 Transcript_111734/m.271438 type:complete len:752 (+) Transcript_111734:2-2257(+)